AGNYSVTVTANGCSTQSAVTTVTEKPLPNAAITGTTSICAGTTTTLTAPGGTGYSYLWSNGATSQSIVVGAGNYSVTVTANGCSTQSAVTTVTEKPLPSATITGTTSICAGTTTTLTAPGGTGYTYLWSTGATSQSISVGAGNYSVTVTANGCSTQSAVTTVTEKPLPNAAITGTTSICAGTTTVLSASTGAGYSYVWSTGATSPTITVGAGSYYVDVTLNGCTRRSATTTVTTKPLPTATISGTTTVCPGSTTTLTASSGAGYTYLWSTGATTPSIAAGAGSYYVDVTLNGCTVRSSTTTVTQLVTATITKQPTPSSQQTTRNTQVSIDVDAAGTGLTFAWYRGGTLGNPGSATLVGTTETLQVSHGSKGTYTYWVRVTGSCGTDTSDYAATVVVR
ncbi:MAG TPA: hypothetical protein VGF69_11425, partial [Thermoanaerobaculia bacterium]